MQIDRYRSDVTCLLWSTNVAAPFGPIAEYQAAPSNYTRAGVPQGAHLATKKWSKGPGSFPCQFGHLIATTFPPKKCKESSPFRPENLHVVSNLGRTVTIVVICQFSNQSQGLDKNIGFLELLIRLFQTVGFIPFPTEGHPKASIRSCACAAKSAPESLTNRRIRTIRTLECLPCFLWDFNDFVYNIRKHRGNFM